MIERNQKLHGQARHNTTIQIWVEKNNITDTYAEKKTQRFNKHN